MSGRFSIGIARSPDSSDERVFDVVTANCAREIVHVDGPHHGASKAIFLYPFHLVPDGPLVVKTDPLVTLENNVNFSLRFDYMTSRSVRLDVLLLSSRAAGHARGISVIQR